MFLATNSFNNHTNELAQKYKRTLVTLAAASFVVRVTLILVCNDSLARIFSSLIL